MRDPQTDLAARSNAPCSPSVAILLCTFNGAKFLEEQIESFLAQDYGNWTLYASDDGSSDETIKILENFQTRLEPNRVKIIKGPREGFAINFLSLIKNKSIIADFYAFSDQDDIWLSSKLSKSIEALQRYHTSLPALFCSRTELITENGETYGYSPLFRQPTTFQNALVQSIAGANTMLINNQARELLSKVDSSHEIVAHDWLAYIIVSGCGGKVIYDANPTLKYRQHQNNLIGANTTLKDRITRIQNLFRGQLKIWSTKNLKAVGAFSEHLTRENTRTLNNFKNARNSHIFGRLYFMWKAKVYRQTLVGNLSLILATILNKI